MTGSSDEIAFVVTFVHSTKSELLYHHSNMNPFLVGVGSVVADSHRLTVCVGVEGVEPPLATKVKV